LNCPACTDGATGEHLGVLGHLTYYRCRDCGIEYHDGGLAEAHRFLVAQDAEDD
jgi:transposase-like protein